MDFLTRYIVPFKRLGAGKHILTYEVDKDFFLYFDYDEIKDANLKVNLELIVQSKGLLMNFDIRGILRVICDRCLDEFDMDFNTTGTLNIEFGSKTDTDNVTYDDTIMISRDESQLNIAKHLFDFIILGLPIKKVHPDNEDGTPGCNAEMSEYIEKYKPKKNFSANSEFQKLKDLLN